LRCYWCGIEGCSGSNSEAINLMINCAMLLGALQRVSARMSGVLHLQTT
jgi:hypothetical protein